MASQWDGEKNAGTDPESVSRGSVKKFWWKCDLGHSWEATVLSRTKGSRCPACAGKVALPGVNDLASQCPEAVAFWSPENRLSPHQVTVKSSAQVWWSCPEPGHTWKARVADMTRRPGCPVCTNRHLVPGVNDLATTHPEHAALWSLGNPTRAEAVTAGSRSAVRWQCRAGHEWSLSPHEQVKRSRPCVECARPQVGDYPEIAAIFTGDPTTPVSDEAGSFACPEGHRFTRSIRATVRSGGCVLCRGRVLVPGVNDLATTHPEHAAWWSASNDRPPEAVTAGSRYRAAWDLPCGHRVRMSVKEQVLQGNGCGVCAGVRVVAGDNDLASTHPELVHSWGAENDVSPAEVTAQSHYPAKWVCGTDPSHAWQTPVYNRTSRSATGCPWCVSPSALEDEVCAYVTGLDIPGGVLRRERGVIAPKELDLYLPAQRVGIEVHGLYWHSESSGKGRDYHAEKLRSCREAGIRLIQVWEDDWRDRREVVKNMLAVKLGRDIRPSVGARTTTAHPVEGNVAAEFLRAHHIQGAVRGTFYDGLFAGDRLVAVLVTTRRGQRYQIDRYATSDPVPGGFGKLLSVLCRRIAASGGGTVVTFSDNEISDGELYRRAGFTRESELRPDYKYGVKGTRQHKFGYRLKRFRTDPELKYQDGLTERELAELNGLPRVWDSGKVRWVLPVSAGS